MGNPKRFWKMGKMVSGRTRTISYIFCKQQYSFKRTTRTNVFQCVWVCVCLCGKYILSLCIVDITRTAIMPYTILNLYSAQRVFLIKNYCSQLSLRSALFAVNLPFSPTSLPLSNGRALQLSTFIQFHPK